MWAENRKFLAHLNYDAENGQIERAKSPTDSRPLIFYGILAF